MITIRVDGKTLIGIVGALLAGALWLGVEHQRIASLESHDTYYHGELHK